MSRSESSSSRGRKKKKEGRDKRKRDDKARDVAPDRGRSRREEEPDRGRASRKEEPDRGRPRRRDVDDDAPVGDERPSGLLDQEDAGQPNLRPSGLRDGGDDDADAPAPRGRGAAASASKGGQEVNKFAARSRSREERPPPRRGPSPPPSGSFGPPRPGGFDGVKGGGKGKDFGGFDGKGGGKGKGKGKGKDDDVEVGASGGQMGSELEGGPPVKKKAAPKAEASDTNAWHAQLLAQSFSMDLDNIDAPAEPGAEAADDASAPPKEPEKPKTGKWVSKEFHSELRARIDARADLGEAMADTVRLGEGPHWKQRYYFEKFKVKQDDLVDFLQRIRKAYVEGLCWVLVYYYQGCASWTWFYPYHYAPFASDLIGCSNLKCGELTYFQQGQPFMPFQQLMSVLPPASSEEAGVPPAMRELMKQPFSPLIDFYPVDFGLDLNGKRFTWLAVILLPFIDEPRLVRILGPLLKRLNANEKMRNRRGQELVFGHRDDKALFHAVQLAQAGFEAGHTGLKQTVRGDRYLFGFIEGWQGGGANKEVVSPIEGLPDVEESHALCAMFTDPEAVPHTSKMLPGIQEMPLVVNAADMDEAARMKGFGGEPAKRMIMQALGKDANARPKYKDIEARQQKREGHAQGAASSSSAPKPGMAAPVAAAANPADALKFDYEEDETEFGDPMEESKVKIAPAPPAGTKVIRVRAAERDRPAPPKAPQGFQPVRRPGQGAQGAGARGAPY